MSFMENQQESSFKHFCRICKKGFMCGRALGGHMRAHGIGDEASNLDDDDEDDGASDWEDKADMNAPLINKRNYALRTNPNRLKTCRVCHNCGKEFFCWKSFLEHGKCSSDDAETSLVSSQPQPSRLTDGDDEDEDEDEDEESRGCKTWSKRKRSFRVKIGNVATSSSSLLNNNEDDDMAALCLVMLSNAAARIEQQQQQQSQPQPQPQPEESCASASRDVDQDQRRNPEAVMAFFSSAVFAMETKAKTTVVTKGLFECKACKKVFNSHQALGGHRASHKKVKGCFAARLLDNGGEEESDNNNVIPTSSKSMSGFRLDESGGSGGPSSGTIANNNNSSKRKSKLHECSICQRIFSSGQALGGHKRCHWLTSSNSETANKFNNFDSSTTSAAAAVVASTYKHPPDGLCLNLNLLPPAPLIEENVAGIRRDPRNPLTLEKDDSKKTKGGEEEEGENNIGYMNNKRMRSNLIMTKQDEEDEAESKVMKLKSINVGGTSSRWLQVGIGSVTADDEQHQQ